MIKKIPVLLPTNFKTTPQGRPIVWAGESVIMEEPGE